MTIVVLIPSYQPNQKLVDLVEGLAHSTSYKIVVVDDGSGSEYQLFFERVALLGAQVEVHPRNLGKGAAIKTGLAAIRSNSPESSVVTADSDGQHRLQDITKVANTLQTLTEPSLVLGAREFDSATPWKSRLGNRASSHLFALLWGKRLSDSQTGLRGISAQLIDANLSVKGDRFEYESNAIIATIAAGIPIVEVMIPATYIDATNSHSHFRPVVDSFVVGGVIFKQLAKFVLSSVLGALVDIATFAIILHAVFSGFESATNVFVSAALARLLSLAVNFSSNYKMVFRSRRNPAVAFLGYLGLAAVVFAVSSTSTIALTTVLGWKAIDSKIVTDITLFFMSFYVQKSAVFKNISTKSRKIGRP